MLNESQVFLLENVERYGRLINVEQMIVRGAHIKIDYVIFGQKIYKIIIVNSVFVDYTTMAKKGRKKKEDGD